MTDSVVTLDLGSNTLRAVRRDCRRGRFTAEYEKIVRTADGLAETGRISSEAVERILKALEEVREAVGFDAAALRAVSTEALRRALNGAEVREQIRERSGISFEIIDGEEEARLTLLAVEERLKRLEMNADSFVLVDIGGGSTELIYRSAGKTLSRSFPLGIVTLSQEAGSLEAVKELLSSRLEPLRRFVREAEASTGPAERFVATAGTPTTVAAMKLGMGYADYDARRINGTRLERAELRHWLTHLLALEPEARTRAVGVGREDLIAAGILIFEGMFDVTGFRECVVIDDGLREGVAIELCGRGKGLESCASGSECAVATLPSSEGKVGK
jgi:exopolyphosphatase/guanosine-5'-triphosphate,3'-diphosphate pyrophosphatase